jgi:hypothetical protein
MAGAFLAWLARFLARFDWTGCMGACPFLDLDVFTILHEKLGNLIKRW